MHEVYSLGIQYTANKEKKNFEEFFEKTYRDTPDYSVIDLRIFQAYTADAKYRVRVQGQNLSSTPNEWFTSIIITANI